MDVSSPPPVAEYRAHLGAGDGIAAAPLGGTLAFIGVTGGAGEAFAPAERLGSHALPYAVLASGIGFVTVAPLVHLVHGRPRAAAASFGARAGLPGVALVLTYALVRASTPNDGQDHVAPGWQGAAAGTLLVGGAFAGALLIDYKLLAVSF